MLTAIQCQKLGVPFINFAEESSKIDFLQQNLLSKLDTLKNSAPNFVLPPTNLNFSDGTYGQIAIDDEYVYICNKNNIWNKIKLND